MERVPIRELNQHTSAVVARVHDTGETVEITKDGKPVARLVPIDKERSFLDRMVAEGRAIAPTLSGQIPMPQTLGNPDLDVAAELAADRENERW
jgi:prevent-host-death family protein